MKTLELPVIPQPQRLQYPLDEAASLLGISKHTVIRDVRLGRIKAKRYGKRILISHDEIVRIAATGMEA